MVKAISILIHSRLYSKKLEADPGKKLTIL